MIEKIIRSTRLKKQDILRFWRDIEILDLTDLNERCHFYEFRQSFYYCFIEKFDMSDKSLAVVNQNDPFWDVHISKLSLIPFFFVLKTKRRKHRNS